MFEKRKLVYSWEERMYRMQKRNRELARPVENKILVFAGVCFVILTLAVSIAGAITQPIVIAEEVIEVEDEPNPIQIQSINPEVVPVKIGGSDQQQEYVQYAWKISGHKIDFLYMLNGENGKWDMHTQSHCKYPGTNIREEAYGFCQVHKPSHQDVYSNPLFMTDWKHQIDTCYQMWDKNPNQFNATKNKYLMETAREQIKLINK